MDVIVHIARTHERRAVEAVLEVHGLDQDLGYVLRAT